jgi:hypothetical protein
MKYLVRIATVIAIMFLVAACATQSQTSVQGVNFVPGKTKIALMPLDVNLYRLTAGGVLEPRADWTESANVHVATAIDNMRQERGLLLTNFKEDDLAPGHQQLISQVVKLHRVVGNEILVQQRVPALRPPTKEGNFNWSIGPHAQLVRQKTGADYGLFVSLKDSYSSGGRVALNILTTVLFGVSSGGGTQVGYASLVHLQTGNIVWFGSLARGTGDLRTAEPAQSAINDLFSGLPKS